MKKVYLVKERLITSSHKDKLYCGLSYYSSYKKAKLDFEKRRVKHSNKEIAYENVEKGTFLIDETIIFKIDEDYNFEIKLESHDVN